MFDTSSFEEEQVIDIFGEISGCSFSDNYFFVGINDSAFSSLLEYRDVKKEKFSNISV